MSPNLGYRYTLTLDDDPMIHKIIEKTTGLTSVPFSTPTSLLEDREKYQPMAVFVDIHLGTGGSGIDLIPKLREQWPFAALMVITSDTSDEALSEAFAAGADDFIRKPIHSTELSARLQSRLGDVAEKEAKNILRLGDITLHLARRSLKGRKGQTYISPTAATILSILIHANGTQVPRQAIKRKVWGEIVVTDNALDRKVHEVRKALQAVSEQVHVRTIYGHGLELAW